MHDKLGTGKYSFVFEGFDILEKKEVILKVLKHGNLDKIHREILTLDAIRNKSPFVAKLVDYGKEELDGAIVLVGPLIANRRYSRSLVTCPSKI